MKAWLIKALGGYVSPPLPAKVAQERISEPDYVLERLNQLETKIERLELDNADRQVAVLTTVEKVMHQLRARTRKRERDAENHNQQDEQRELIPATSAHLAARFRS